MKKEATSPIDKVAVAIVFAELLEENTIISKKHIEQDPYLFYLVNSIKHVCGYEN